MQKAVTHLDLANLENKITEQQTKIRHDQRNEFWEKLFIVDELKTESKVNNLIMVNMQKDIEEIKVMLKEIVKSLPTTYVSKEELIPIKEKQKSHDEIISKYKSTIASIIGALIVYAQAKQYIDNDQAMAIISISGAIFGSINISNHIKSK